MNAKWTPSEVAKAQIEAQRAAHWYLLTWRDDRVWLIGAFDSAKTAGDWGSDPANNPHDNPCWQVVQLAAPTAPMEIVPPFEPMPA